jgi:hypothetical protein
MDPSSSPQTVPASRVQLFAVRPGCNRDSGRLNYVRDLCGLAIFQRIHQLLLILAFVSSGRALHASSLIGSDTLGFFFLTPQVLGNVLSKKKRYSVTLFLGFFFQRKGLLLAIDLDTPGKF